MTLQKTLYFTALMTCSLVAVASFAGSAPVNTENAGRAPEVGVDTKSLGRMEKTAEAYRRKGLYSYAEPIIQKAFEIRQRLKGPDDHAHLGIPIAVWQKKYRGLANDEILPALLREPSLAALYQQNTLSQTNQISHLSQRFGVQTGAFWDFSTAARTKYCCATPTDRQQKNLQDTAGSTALRFSRSR